MKSFGEFINEKVAIDLAYHDHLNPALWTSTDSLKPGVREELLALAWEWIKFAGVNEHAVRNILLTGSSTNYNWTSHSDVDVHVIVDTAQSGGSPEQFAAKKKAWTLTKRVLVAGMPFEPYVQDQNERAPLGQGVYSISQDAWIEKPDHGHYDFANDPWIQKKVDHFYDAAQHAIANGAGLEVMKRLRRRIRDMRQSGFQKAGEFSRENLTFKALRNSGIFDAMNAYEEELQSK